MDLYRKVQAVQRVFAQLEKETRVFKKHTALKCFSGCINCCLKPDIYATPLEFLPLAYHLYKRGEADTYLDSLQKNTGTLCINLSQITGNAGCMEYADRGLICRLFGFSAMVNKYNKEVLVTCQRIKTESKDVFDNAVIEINNGLNVPMLTDYYTKLRFIDSELGAETVPINQAIKEAIETVLWYYTYRAPRRPRKAS